MKSLLQCMMLCAILAIAIGYDSDESNESFEDVFLRPNRANTFIRTPGRNNYHNYNYRSLKPPHEQRSEICETHYSCRVMARRYGTNVAYSTFFGHRQAYNGRRY